MSIGSEITKRFKDEVSTVVVNKHVELHGEAATEVVVCLLDGRTVTGTFTNETKPGFGGVVFSSTKDVIGLMSSKIDSVLRGTAE